MSTSYLPGKDGDLAGWLTNYAAVAAINKEVLGLTSADIQAAQGVAADFSQDLADANDARAAAKTAVVTKDRTRKRAEQVIRPQVKKIQANPALSDTLRSQLKITVPKPRRKVLPVFAPGKLVAEIKAGGIISLAWDANGNEAGAIYVIESSPTGASSTWTILNAQSSLRFLDGSVGGAARVYYRVRAQRAKVISDPSSVVVVMPGAASADDSLHLSDAA